VPLLVELVEGILRGNLSEDIYEYVESAPRTEIPQYIFVYIIGGCTYSEA